MTNTLTMWTVYDHPDDYPDAYVAREWAIASTPTPVAPAEPVATGSVVISPRIEVIYEFLDITLGLYRLGRQPEDEPQIIGTWI